MILTGWPGCPSFPETPGAPAIPYTQSKSKG